MTLVDAARLWSGRGLAVAGFVLACLAVNTVLLWRSSGIDEKVARSPEFSATRAASQAERAPAAHPTHPPRVAARVESSQPTQPSLVAFGTTHVAVPVADVREEPIAAPSPQRPPEAVRPAVKAPKMPVDAGSGSDRTPPALQMLRFDPPVVDGGRTTTLTVEASDALSGVKSFKGELRSPNGLATLPFWSQGVGGDLPGFALTIPREAQSGTWYVSWILVADGADNSLLIQAPSAAAAPQGGTLVVSSSESDSTAPEVVQIWLDRSTVDGGDSNVVKVEARDDVSGVASIEGACQSSSKSALIWFTCTPSAEPGVWEGEVKLPKNADCGSWQVQQLSVKDKAGNTSLLIGNSPVLARAGFQVSTGTDCDSTPPSLDAFELTPTSIASDTPPEFVVTATVYDAGSGAAAMSGWFEGPVSEGGQVPKIDFRCAPDPEDPEAPWSGIVQVPSLATKGVWRVGYIHLEDKAHNFREYGPGDPVISDRVVELQ